MTKGAVPNKDCAASFQRQHRLTLSLDLWDRGVLSVWAVFVPAEKRHRA